MCDGWQVQYLDKEELEDVSKKFPAEARLIRKAAVLMSVQCAVKLIISRYRVRQARIKSRRARKARAVTMPSGDADTAALTCCLEKIRCIKACVTYFVVS